MDAPPPTVYARLRGVGLAINRRTVLDHVDLEILEGEVLAVMGVNGAGKSSLLRCLAGVWKADCGEITIRGLDRFRDDLEIRGFTVYLPPDPSLPALTLRENLRLFAEAYGVGEAEYRMRMDGLLRMFDLKDRQDSSVLSLSKGQMKKACLAAVLLPDADFFILDEPFTGGLDPRGYEALRRVLTRLAQGRRRTIVFATQAMDTAECLADRIALVQHGRVGAIGTKEDLRLAAGLPPAAPMAEVFDRLTSRDIEAPIGDYLASLGRQGSKD